MSFFEEAARDPKGLERKLMGPTYKYYNQIKTPAEMGMSSKGSFSALSKDIAGIVNYVEVLVSGGGNASKTGRPLGNKFFVKTGGQCKDVKSGKLVDRYIYVNNVPLGNVPFISQGVNANFSEFRGIIPGIMSNMNAVNPVALMGAFMQGKEPDCVDLTMEVVDNNNNSSQQTHFITKSDIANLDPCAFPDRRNPETGNNCRMTFTDMNGNELSTLDNIYVLSISGLLMYIMYKYWSKI